MDFSFRTLLIFSGSNVSLNVNVFFDVLLAGTCLAPGFYLVRTILQIYKYDELSMLKYEWIPMLTAGIFFVMWVAESSYFDYVGDFGVRFNAVKDATLLASVSIFAFAVARFADTWGGYVKGINLKKKMVQEGEMIEVAIDEGKRKRRQG